MYGISLERQGEKKGRSGNESRVLVGNCLERQVGKLSYGNVVARRGSAGL